MFVPADKPLFNGCTGAMRSVFKSVLLGVFDKIDEKNNEYRFVC